MTAPGPDALARNVVAADGAAPPAGWPDAEVVVVDEAVLVDPGPVVGRLHELWSTRRRAVIALRVDTVRCRPPATWAAVPGALETTFTPWRNPLQHRVHIGTTEERAEKG